MRILSGASAAKMVRRLASRASNLSSLEPQVRAIIANVRRSGDTALRRYAERWDSLSKNQPLAVSEAEMTSAWESAAPDVRRSLT